MHKQINARALRLRLQLIKKSELECKQMDELKWNSIAEEKRNETAALNFNALNWTFVSNLYAVWQF